MSRADGRFTSGKYQVLADLLRTHWGYKISPRTLEDRHKRPFRGRL